MASVQSWDMEDEENIEEELFLVESQLHDIQGMIIIFFPDYLYVSATYWIADMCIFQV